jgi:hypothetical protein
MKTASKLKKQISDKEAIHKPDFTSPDKDADKTGSDSNSDCTEKTGGLNKYDKPKREADPDTTGIDINSDKTKKEKTQNHKKNK